MTPTEQEAERRYRPARELLHAKFDADSIGTYKLDDHLTVATNLYNEEKVISAMTAFASQFAGASYAGGAGMNLFQKADLILHSGQAADFKIECDALTDADWECLAFIISKQVKFSQVIGVPSGGIKLAEKLLKYRISSDPNSLVVDDVLTTGKSMDDCRRSSFENPFSVNVRGVVVFARGVCPDWITPIFTMSESPSPSVSGMREALAQRDELLKALKELVDGNNKMLHAINSSNMRGTILHEEIRISTANAQSLIKQIETQ